MQKRGILTLELLVKLVPILLLIVAFFAAIFIIIPALMGDSSAESKNTVQSLGFHVNSLLSSNEVFKQERMISTLSKGAIVKGYSSDQKKPSQCGDTPCICFWQGDPPNVIEQKPNGCQLFDELVFYDKVVFLTVPDPLSHVNEEQFKKMFDLDKDSISTKYPETIPAKDFSYGHLTYWNGWQDKSDTFNEFYIEKYAVDRTAFILIANIRPDAGKDFSLTNLIFDGKTFANFLGMIPGITQEQINLRVNKLKPCPEDSDEACVGISPYSKVAGGICSQVDGKCRLVQISECELNIKISNRCLCDNKIIESGFCTQDVFENIIALPFSCKIIGECSHYCNAISNNEFSCEDSVETGACATNPCKIAGNCKNSENTCIIDNSSS